LADHQRQGKKYLPYMARLPLLLSDSLKDEAPEFLWPSVLWVLGGDNMVSQICGLQQSLSDRLGEESRESARRHSLDGRMSTLELWDDELRGRHKDFLVERGASLGVFPDDFIAVLRLYGNVPGGWLLLEPWRDKSIDIPVERTFGVLATALAEWARKGHVQALGKYLTFTWAVLRRTFTADAVLIDHLRDYPRVPSKMASAESLIRAAYGSMRALDGPESAVGKMATEWVGRFWNANWGISGCMPADVSVADPASEAAETVSANAESTNSAESPTAQDDSQDLSMRFAGKVEGEVNRFGEAYFGAAKRELFNTRADEVVAGLTMRAIKSVAAIVRVPHQWSTPFAANTFRLLAETEIMLAWFRVHPEDYEAYKSYGRGRDKLNWLHVEDVIDSFGGDVPEELRDVVKHLERRKRESSPLDITVVSVDSTFNGKSMRKMADEVGLAQLYRTTYQSSSAILHGEWGPIEEHDMTRCVNPLHGFHLIPSFEPPWIEDERIPRLMMSILHRVVTQGIAMLQSEDATE
jgi:hypothetical protein